MSSVGLGLGQISFPTIDQPGDDSLVEFLPEKGMPEPEVAPREEPAPVVADATDDEASGVPAMFGLVAGTVERPLRERSGASSTLLSVVAHSTVVGGIVLTVAMTQSLVLPNPQEADRLVAMLLAPPPPPPPPPAAPAPAAPAPAPEVRTVEAANPTPPVERLTPIPAVNPELALPAPNLEPIPPEVRFAPSPMLSSGLGSGFGGGEGGGSGGGFGVDGGVGWGTGSGGPSGPVRVGGEITTPTVVHRVEPVYPPDAVAGRLEGTVVVEATVDEQGQVRDVRVLRSLGVLDQAAVDAVMQWRYSPLTLEGNPASFVVTVNVTFRLH